jgi:hypothetical protein
MPATLPLDPALPALQLGFDLDALSSRFQELTERTRGQGFTVNACRRTDTTYAPGVRYVAAYELAGEGPDGSTVRTFGVLDVQPSGATHRLFPDDPELPTLATATSGEGMRERLAALSADVMQFGAVDDCKITPVRYKPGQRCVLRYDLSSQGKRAVLFGKLIATGGEQLMATLASLRDARETTPAMPPVPRPLCHWPDLELVMQSAVTAGPSLTVRAMDLSSPTGARARWMGAAGSSVGAMHRTLSASGPQRTLEEDARELQDYETLFSQLAPDLARRFHDAVAEIGSYAPTAGEPALVASHGALRTDQFLVDDDRGLVMMDLDGFCWAPSSRDVGNLLAYLDWRAIRRPEDSVLIDEARRAFLEGYGTVAPIPLESELAAFRAASMLKIAGRRFQSLAFEEWQFVPKLVDAAWDTLPA